MKPLLWRTAGLLLHAIANFLFVSFLFRYDITGSWFFFICFIIVVLLLLFLFISHIVSYIYFLKKIKK